jgi:hypothetical protein
MWDQTETTHYYVVSPFIYKWNLKNVINSLPETNEIPPPLS